MIESLAYIVNNHNNSVSYDETELIYKINEIIDTLNDMPRKEPKILIIQSNGEYEIEVIREIAEEYNKYMNNLGCESMCLLELPGLKYCWINNEQVTKMTVEELSEFLKSKN